MGCPRASVDANSFFLLAEAIICNDNENPLSKYINGCDPICQRVKATAFVNMKSGEEGSATFFEELEKKFENEKDYYTTSVEILTTLSNDYAAAQDEESDPDELVARMSEKIEASNLSDEEKVALQQKVQDKVKEKVNTNEVERYLEKKVKAEIIKKDAAKTNQEAATTKKNSAAAYFSKAKM